MHKNKKTYTFATATHTLDRSKPLSFWRCSRKITWWVYSKPCKSIEEPQLFLLPWWLTDPQVLPMLSHGYSASTSPTPPPTILIQSTSSSAVFLKQIGSSFSCPPISLHDAAWVIFQNSPALKAHLPCNLQLHASSSKLLWARHKHDFLFSCC